VNARKRLRTTLATATTTSPSAIALIRPRAIKAIHTGASEASIVAGASIAIMKREELRYSAPTQCSRKRSPTTQGARQKGTAREAVIDTTRASAPRLRFDSPLASSCVKMGVSDERVLTRNPRINGDQRVPNA